MKQVHSDSTGSGVQFMYDPCFLDVRFHARDFIFAMVKIMCFRFKRGFLHNMCSDQAVLEPFPPDSRCR